MLRRPRSTTRLVIGLLLVLVTGSSAAAQEPKSAALAKELTQVLDSAKLTAIAAKDASETDTFVAAMYFAGSQLLVVKAKYEPSVLLMAKLANKDYQEIYIDLNSASVARTRVFLEDLGADGMKATHPDNVGFDSMEQDGKRTLFDDDWRKTQKMSEEEYARLFAETDALYARLLQTLIVQAKR
jgi:hypothetical protein